MPTGGGVSRIYRMGGRRAAAIAGCAGAVSGGNVAAERNGELAVDGAEETNAPRVLLVGEVDAAVVPGVAIGIEAASRLD